MDPDTLRKLAQGFIASLGETKDAGGLIVRRPVIVRADSLDEKTRTVRMLASSDAVDSYGDIVEQDFLLQRYQKNPVVLYGHNRVGVFGAGGAPEWTLPIGYSTEVGVGADGLEATLHIVSKKANPFAELVWQGFLEQSIRASSIGFFPHEVEEKQDELTGETTFHLRKNELFEISVVPIGANPDAVAGSSKSRALEKAWFHQRALDGTATRTRTISVPEPPSPEPAPEPTPEKAALPPEEIPMTEAEKKELDDAKAAQKAAEEKAAKAETRASTAETKLASLEQAGTDAAISTEVRALVGKKIKADQVESFVALRKQNAETFKSIVAGLPDLPEADTSAIEKDVDALLGKKITPDQKADFVELRTLAPTLFRSIADKLLELPHTKSITPTEAKPITNKAAKTGGTSTISKNAAKAAEDARNGADS